MIDVFIWSFALCLGYFITSMTVNSTCASGTLVAGIIVCTSFQLSRFFKVAGRHAVTKMSTAWVSRELRRIVWRVTLTLALAGLAFKLAWPEWGVAYWLSVAAYYQLGLLLHLREIRQPSSRATEKDA